MKKNLFKGYLLGILSALLIGGVSIAVEAASDSIKSQGRLVADGVVFDASDFDILEETIETSKEIAYNQGYDEGYNDWVSNLAGHRHQVYRWNWDQSLVTDNGRYDNQLIQVDCTGIPNYQYLTVDNFILTKGTEIRHSTYTGDGGNPDYDYLYGKQTGEYDSEAGIFSFRTGLKSGDSGFSWSGWSYWNVKCFY